MKKYLPLLLLFFSFTQVFSQVKIKTYDYEFIYGIVVASDDSSLTIKQPDKFKHFVLRDNIIYMDELIAEIVTKDSMVFSGHIFFENEDSIFCKVGYKEEMSFGKNRILDIKYDTDEEEQTETVKKKRSVDTTLSAIDEIDGMSYWMVGATILCPGGFNLLVGKQNKDGFGIRLQAGTFISLETDISVGAQINFMYNLKKTADSEHNISIGLGGSMYREYPDREMREWFYPGIFYDINICGFFLETGLTFNRGVLTDCRVYAQIGYVYRAL